MDLTSATWRTSSYSGNNGGNCVEVGNAAQEIVIRDSTDPYGPVLAVGAKDWQRFTEQVKVGA